MRKGSFLLTRPNHEPTVNYLFAWAEKVLEISKKKNIFSIDLSKSSANKKQFVSSVKRFRPSFIYLNGHGSLNSVTGFDNKPILSFADNEEITNDCVVYALSCQSAKRLGKSCVSRGQDLIRDITMILFLFLTKKTKIIPASWTRPLLIF